MSNLKHQPVPQDQEEAIALATLRILDEHAHRLWLHHAPVGEAEIEAALEELNQHLKPA